MRFENCVEVLDCECAAEVEQQQKWLASSGPSLPVGVEVNDGAAEPKLNDNPPAAALRAGQGPG